MRARFEASSRHEPSSPRKSHQRFHGSPSCCPAAMSSPPSPGTEPRCPVYATSPTCQSGMRTPLAGASGWCDVAQWRLVVLSVIEDELGTVEQCPENIRQRLAWIARRATLLD